MIQNFRGRILNLGGLGNTSVKEENIDSLEFLKGLVDEVLAISTLRDIGYDCKYLLEVRECKQGSHTSLAPSLTQMSFNSLSFPSLLAAMTILARNLDSFLANSHPIPLEAPVITMTLSLYFLLVVSIRV